MARGRQGCRQIEAAHGHVTGQLKVSHIHVCMCVCQRACVCSLFPLPLPLLLNIVAFLFPVLSQAVEYSCDNHVSFCCVPCF